VLYFDSEVVEEQLLAVVGIDSVGG